MPNSKSSLFIEYYFMVSMLIFFTFNFKMIDYLIVGSGLAGISFSEIALQNNKSILVLDNNSQNSSKIAGGLYNPVILKRFSEVWQAKEHLLIINQFFANLEKKLDCKVDFKMPILQKIFFGRRTK